jgi:2-haloacid dehalogenase
MRNAGPNFTNRKRRHIVGFNRRAFLNVAAAGLAAGVSARATAMLETGAGGIKAIAFDAFPILDPRPTFALAEALFPGKGEALSAAWRTRQFEYQWLRALSGQYADFWTATEDALVFAAEWLKLDLTPATRTRLMQAYLELRAWPDVAPALHALRADGVRLALLSNATSAILESGIRNAALAGVFEHVLSTDAIRSYKPAPAAYRMATDALGLEREEVLFCAFAGWDAAGAKAFGYRTFWVNRLGLPVEQLGSVPDGIGKGLDDLVAYVGSRAG